MRTHQPVAVYQYVPEINMSDSMLQQIPTFLVYIPSRSFGQNYKTTDNRKL